jgi:diguanylate cyclase (GGDEF)-like protein/PAS domain S-box-containing protein
MKHTVNIALFSSPATVSAFENHMATGKVRELETEIKLEVCESLEKLYYKVFSRWRINTLSIVCDETVKIEDVQHLAESLRALSIKVPFYQLRSDTTTDLESDGPIGICIAHSVEEVINAVTSLAGHPGLIQTDYQQLHTINDNLHQLQQTYSLLVNAAGEGIVGLDGRGCIGFANPAACRLLNCSLHQLIGRPFSDFALDSPLKHGASVESFKTVGQSAPRVGRGLIKRNHKEYIYVEYTQSFVGEDNSGIVSVMVIEDISERIKFETKLYRLANSDSLTGLFNRRYFELTLANELNDRRKTNDAFSIALLDLDGFKEVNDSYGHPIGDKLLILVAKRLKEHLRRDDVVARLGGDEFAILIKNTHLQATDALIIKIQHSLATPFQFDSYVIQISASIGLHHVKDRDVDAATLLKRVDDAMYSVKNNSKNGIAIC